MPIHWADYTILGAYLVFAMLVGVFMREKKREGTMRSFFLSKQNMPWWLLGTSMAATTFSIGMPVLVAGWAHANGVAKLWEWYPFLIGGMLTAFFFSRLWRRTNVVSDAEYTELRYQGRGAAFLRGFRALYMGLTINSFVLGAGLVGIAKVGPDLLGIDPYGPIGWNVPVIGQWQARWTIAVMAAGVAVFYSASSGFRGIIVTDFAQFAFSMIGTIVICVYAVGHSSVGGLAGLVKKLSATAPDKLRFMPGSTPDGNVIGVSLGAFILFLTIRWWAQVYGGSEPGGQVYVAQRMLAARDERHALGATVLFNVFNFVRPLPWILTGLACLFIFPDVADGQTAYTKAIHLVPPVLKGLVLVGFVSAFMSTVDTRLNLGAAYFVNDFYRRFCCRHKSETHYVLVSRIVTVLQIVIGFFWLLPAEDPKDMFFLYAALGAGSGSVFIARWYWWRVSAWSEVAAMATSLALFVLFRWGIYDSAEQFNQHSLQILVITAVVVTATWIVVALATRPGQAAFEHLKDFYRKVRPSFGWGPVARAVAEEDGKPVATDAAWPMLVGWISSTLCIYALIIGTGKLVLLAYGSAAIWLLVVFVPTLLITTRTITTMISSSPDAAHSDVRREESCSTQ